MSTLKVTAHLLAYNEQRIIPFSVRHFLTFCESVTVHDLGSQDRTREFAIKEGAKIRQWDCKGKTDDPLNSAIKSSCWANDDTDWFICGDADELLWFPQGAEASLDAYEKQQLAFVKPHGFEMTSETFPTTKGQIYEEVKWGARDDHWYGKVNLFSKKRVASTEIGMGAHAVTVWLKDGSRVHVPQGSPQSEPPCYLTHMHHLGSIEEIGAGYDAIIKRHGEMNKNMGWGIQANPVQHAIDKRTYILERIQKIIP